MNPEQVMNQLGVNAITGTRLLDLLDISMDDLRIPQTFSKVQDIINFLAPLSEDTQRFMIQRATAGKMVDKVKHFHEYIQLVQKNSSLQEQYEALNAERRLVEGMTTPEETELFESKKQGLEKNIQDVLEEMGIYER